MLGNQAQLKDLIPDSDRFLMLNTTETEKFNNITGVKEVSIESPMYTDQLVSVNP